VWRSREKLPRLTPGGDRRFEKPGENTPYLSRRLRLDETLTELGEDLLLAEDRGLEPGGYPVEMSDGPLTRAHLRRNSFGQVAEEVVQDLVQFAAITGHCHLDTETRRKYETVLRLRRCQKPTG
jgi:hypothetical protein